MKRIAILLLAAAPACAAREASERPAVGPAPVARSASSLARAEAPPSLPLRAFTHAPNCAGWPASTEIGVERTANGAALVFANADHIGPLRDRVAAMPEAKSAAAAVRLDNVDYGIRLVYEGGGSVSEVHESAKLRARELRRVCGLARYIRESEPAPAERAATTADTPPPSSPPTSTPVSGTSKADGTQASQADDKPQDKPGEKPKPASTAKNGDKPAVPPPPPNPTPKEPVKPRPPDPPKPGDPRPPEPPRPPESPFPRT